MSLNQLLYATDVAKNLRKWLDIIVDSVRFGAKADGFTQRPLDYYSYNPDAPDTLALTPTSGTITGSLTVDVARLGRLVTIQLNTPNNLTISENCVFTTTALASNMRPAVDVLFQIPAVFEPTDPAYDLSLGSLIGKIGTNGVISFEGAYFAGIVIDGGGVDDAFYSFTRPQADESIPAGTIDIQGACISYLHAV